LKKFKLTIINPHVDGGFYTNTVFHFLTKRKTAKRYDYFFHWLKKSKDIELNFFFDKRDSSFVPKFPLLIDIIFWYMLNRINPFRHKPIFNLKKINSDFLFCFNHRNFDRVSGSELVNDLNKIKSKIVIHMTHYHAGISDSSANINKLKRIVYTAESDLSKSEFFTKHYNRVKPFYILPGVPKSRFKFENNFENRKNICVATGTVNWYPKNSRYNEFINFFDTDCLHPMRNSIYNTNNKKINNYIISYISNYNEKTRKTYEKKDNFFQKINKKIYNNFLAKQTDYFKFDIVKLFNSYKMFIVPEEITGLPGISYVEGMKCGSAFIGLSHDMYFDIGLKKDINFISYDGTIENLIEKIKYYQKNDSQLKKIAENGYYFSKKYLNPDRVMTNFISYLKNLN